MSASHRQHADLAQPTDRRLFLLAAGAAAAMCPLGRLEAAAGDKLLRRAIRRAGGYKLLSRVRLLSWDGEATVFDGDRRIELGVSTIVAPFASARSTSWLLSQGKASARTMIIGETGGRMERDEDGRREAMDKAKARQADGQPVQQAATFDFRKHPQTSAGVYREPT